MLTKKQQIEVEAFSIYASLALEQTITDKDIEEFIDYTAKGTKSRRIQEKGPLVNPLLLSKKAFNIDVDSWRVSLVEDTLFPFELVEFELYGNQYFKVTIDRLIKDNLIQDRNYI